MAVDPGTLTATNILVIAPHPDDESLGCGGLISKLAAQGRRFHTIFVTDGGASHPGSRKWPRKHLVAQREREAADALHHLGIGDHPRTFLRLRDAAMPPVSSAQWRAARAKTAQVIQSFRPGLILVPWRRDPHCDHRNSWKLVKDAVSMSATKSAILEYTIWLEEFGREEDYPRAHEVEPIVFGIASAVASKRAAIAAHISQTTDLIDDDPGAFRLTPMTIARLTRPYETYWRAIDEAY